MTLHNTTPVPNEILDHLKTLPDKELRVLLLIIRQTYGWYDFKTKQRKVRDWMTYQYIINRTGLYRTCLSSTIQILINKGLISVTDYFGKELSLSSQRKGHRSLYYSYCDRKPIRPDTSTNPKSETPPVPYPEHNKRKTLQKKFKQKKFQPNLMSEQVRSELTRRMDNKWTQGRLW